MSVLLRGSGFALSSVVIVERVAKDGKMLMDSQMLRYRLSDCISWRSYET